MTKRPAGRAKREVVDCAPLADEDMLRAEMRQTLVRALKDMPLLYRAPVILRDVQGLTHRRGQRSTSREGTDAEVAAASRTADAARAAHRFLERIVVALRVRQKPNTTRHRYSKTSLLEEIAEKDDRHRSHSHEPFVEGSGRIRGAPFPFPLFAQRVDRVLAQVVGNRLRRPLRVAIDLAIGFLARRPRIWRPSSGKRRDRTPRARRSSRVPRRTSACRCGCRRRRARARRASSALAARRDIPALSRTRRDDLRPARPSIPRRTVPILRPRANRSTWTTNLRRRRASATGRSKSDRRAASCT